MQKINNEQSEKRNTPLKQRNFMRFSEKIEQIKKPISTALGGVLEYQKNDEYISIKLFNSKNKTISKWDIENAHMFIQHYSNQLKRLKDELLQEPNLEDAQKKLLLNIIQGNILRSILLYYATYIEAEKGGYKIAPEEKEEYLKKIEKIENIIYGPKVSESREEKEIVIKNLCSIFNQNKSILNDDESLKFSHFLKSQTEEKILNFKKETKEAEQGILGEKISMISVCHLFEKILNIYNIKNKIIIIKDSINQEYEESNIFYIPANYDQKQREDTIKKYKLKNTVKIILDKNLPNFGIGENKVDIPANLGNISIKRFCELIDHELNTHLIRMINKNKGINIKTEGYLETEEGIASLNEKMVSNKRENIKVDEPTIHNTSIFIGENYGFKETKELLYIYYILQGKTKEEAENLSEQRALRVKRYHAFDLPGANRKDVVYRRGLVDAVAYIKGFDKNKTEDLQRLQKDTENFFIAKLGKEETINAEELFAGFNINKDELIMPIAIGKILYEKLLGHSTRDIDDIRFSATNQKLDNKQKRLLIEIKELIKNGIIK